MRLVCLVLIFAATALLISTALGLAIFAAGYSVRALHR